MDEWMDGWIYMGTVIDSTPHGAVQNKINPTGTKARVNPPKYTQTVNIQRAHTHRVVTREWLWQPKGSFGENTCEARKTHPGTRLCFGLTRAFVS